MSGSIDKVSDTILPKDTKISDELMIIIIVKNKDMQIGYLQSFRISAIV
jgi:hypothetical protein